jgi:DNA-binding MarR family transcriptional regulator
VRTHSTDVGYSPRRVKYPYHQKCPGGPRRRGPWLRQLTDPRFEEETEAILGSFASLMRYVSGWHAPDFLGLDVTMSQAKCLYLVSLRPGIGMSAMAEQLGVGPSAISGLADRLVEHGYLERHEDPSDRRHLQLYLTAAGEVVVDRIRELNTEHFRRLLLGMDGSELQALRRGIAALAREARRIHDQETPVPEARHERNPA